MRGEGRGDAPDAALRLPDLPRPSPLAGDSLPHLFLRSWAGRLLLGSAALKACFALVEVAGGTLGTIVASSPLNTLASVVLFVALVVVAWRAFGIARRRLLWRVRRRLIISYIFIGVVPALLIVSFFLLAAFLMFVNVSGYLFKRGIDDVVDEAVVLAQTAAGEMRRGAGAAGAREVLERKLSNNVTRYPEISLALLRVGNAPSVSPTTAGSWEHAAPPTEVPEWVSRTGFGGLLAFDQGNPDDTRLVVRALGFPDQRDPSYAVVVDVPVDEQVIAQLHDATGIELKRVSLVTPAGDTPKPARGRISTAPRSQTEIAGTPDRLSLGWVTVFDYTDWATGATGSVTLQIRVGLREIYERVSSAQSRVFNVSMGTLFIAMLGLVGILFLIIEVVALITGFALARSITGAVHELFLGTERVQSGDFSHRISVRTHDQLGELAGSFNNMTASIEALLRQADEKKRLEEELRIAREIQMSLLPHGPVRMPGLSMTALCVPAREVGGDYYDFFPLSDTRLGLLIADVAGKGTSAALYMAELKGVVLSLSRICDSPRQLLVEVNRIISANIDSRSFITMTYAIVDVAARTLTYARAGHTPLLHVPVRQGRRVASVLAPDGLVLGLRLDGVAQKFEQLLEESTIRLATGDVLVFFTDGITEAMNPASDLFGEQRLQALVEQHGDLPSDQLRERILRELDAFVGTADQHDDMTMILLKVEGADAVAPPVAVASSVGD